MAWTKGMVDMELDDEDKLDFHAPIAMKTPDYPCGLRICLTEKELSKLGLDADCDIGDYLDVRALACVTHVSKTKDGTGEECCRVELQIEKMALQEDGDGE